MYIKYLIENNWNKTIEIFQLIIFKIHDNLIIQILSIYLNESDEYYLKNSMDIEFIIEFFILTFYQ